MALHPIDLAVLVVYLLVITALGTWMGRQVHSMGDFFMPRRFGKAMMIFHAFGTGTASDQAVVVAGQTFKSGLSGIWWQWLWLPSTPFYWIIAAVMRRLRAVTTADVYELRFDQSVAWLFALVGIANLSVKIGLLLKGSSALVDSCTAGLIDANLAIAAVTVLFVAYGMAGGLGAAIVTDFVQGLLTVVFSFLLLPFVLQAVGGIAGVRETIQDPAMLSLLSPGEIDAFFIAMFSLQALIGIVAQPFIMGVCAAGRTELDGRVGFMVGNIVKRICTAAWSLTAIAAVAWYMNRGVDRSQVIPDHVYGEVARAFLPGFLPGLLGLFLACLLASVMSSCDSYMISSSALFTTNLYKPLRPRQSDAHYLLVGRAVALLVVVGGVVFAYWIPTVTDALSVWFRIAPMMGIAFWLGLIWRRTTVAGAWAATLTGFATWWVTAQPWFADWLAKLPAAESLRIVVARADNGVTMSQPWEIAFYLLAATAMGIVVSLATRPVDQDKLDRFYALTRTPIVPGEEITEPCTLPAGVAPRPRKMLLTAGGLEIPVPSRTSVAGFIAGWLAIAAMVGGFVWIMG